MTERRVRRRARSGRWNPRRIARILEAGGELARAELTVRRDGGRRWRAALGVRVDPDAAAPDVVKDEALRVAEALATASRRSPGSHRCLVEAVAAIRMLRRRDIPARTYIGGARDQVGQPVELHAWVVSGPVCVAGGAEQNRYQPVVAYDRSAGAASRAGR